ncbi:MAG: type III-B CRISPR-associated protein Cas10/Cmr2 [Planctomycetota bacterium]
MTRLSFSLGPVQSFVARSRRTRDLWSSSYLLSYLIANALMTVQEGGATIEMPDVENDPLLHYLAGGTRDDDAPLIGSLPNHFEASFKGSDEKATALLEEVATNLVFCFEQIADQVFDRAVRPVLEEGRGTEEIWERQIANFFDIRWSVGESHELLERRKRWRFRETPPEPGDKCTLFGDLQELSGYERRLERPQQEKFWAEVRRRLPVLDLRPDERLCAVALVKRLFPTVCAGTNGLPTRAARWPSTAYLAAIPFIRDVGHADPAAASQFAAEATRLARKESLHDCGAQLPGLQQIEAGDWTRLDGNFYFAGTLDDPGRTLLDETAGEPERRRLRNLLEALGRVSGPARPYFALLLMDGDSLGRTLAEGRLKPAELGRILSRFSRQVPGIVRDHDGACVYAGGDDLMALLPLPDALPCARALRQAYRSCFDQVDGSTGPASISAGLVFAHFRAPFRTVLEEARTNLDREAKDRNGRDSLAVSVLKGSARHLLWTSCWETPEADHDRVQDLLDLSQGFARKGPRGVSTSFLYRLRETLGLLGQWPRWRPGRSASIPEEIDLEAFVLSECVRAHEITAGPVDQQVVEGLKVEMRQILSLSSRVRRDEQGVIHTFPRQVALDGTFLARFLALGPEEDR